MSDDEKKKLKNVGEFAADLALFRWKQIQFWVNSGSMLHCCCAALFMHFSYIKNNK